MRKKFIIMASAGLILLVCIFIIASHNRPSGVMGNNEIQPLQAGFDDLLSHTALINDSFIYLSLDGSVATYYRYYINNNQKVAVGTINGFYLGTKNTVLIDGKLYFYVNVIEDNKEDITNTLFCIDLSKNSMSSYENDDNSLPGILTYQFGGDIITLKNRADGEITTTYLDIFDVNSKSWRQENINVVDSGTNTGSVIFGLYGNKETVYVLHNDCSGRGNTYTSLKTYDGNMKELRTINIDGDLKSYILGSGIQEIAVFGDYIYTNNRASYALLGKINGGTIEPVIKERNLELALNQTSPEAPFFYVRRSNKCYMLDTETGTISTVNLQIGNGYSIQHILADEKNILLTCFSEDKSDYKYYLKKDNLSSTYIPCE